MYSSRHPSINGRVSEKKITRDVAVALVSIGWLLCVFTPESSRCDFLVAAEGSRAASVSGSAVRGRDADAFVAAPSASSLARAPLASITPPPPWGLPGVNRAGRRSRSLSGGGGGVGRHADVTTRRRAEDTDTSTAASRSSPPSNVVVDRTAEATSFYSYVESCGPVASENLDLVALGYFHPPGKTAGPRIRGVVALRPIGKGEVILNIPYEMALNLGKCGRDPTLPAYNLLQEICRAQIGQEDETTNGKGPGIGKRNDVSPYLATLPEFRGRDCLGSPLFLSDEALDALQAPFIKEETLARREICALRYERDVEPLTLIGDGSLFELNLNDGRGATPATEEHLRWAVWLASSRSIALPGAPGSDGSPASSFRLMVPLVDMCNHDRDSPHVVEGEVGPDGTVRVVAGRDVEEGEQISICYGGRRGGGYGNDRLLQDYGFLDTNVEAYRVVARELLGEQSDGTMETLTSADRKGALVALRQTSIEVDRSLLEDSARLERDMRLAVEFRLGVKSALLELE